jgi:dimethylamine monooxygenase subunit A
MLSEIGGHGDAMALPDTSGIHQTSLPFAPWMTPHSLRLPGTRPIALTDWLVQDEVFAAQMAARDRLTADAEPLVHHLGAGAEPAAEELRALVLGLLEVAPGYAREGAGLRRPDGVLVPRDGPPLLVLGRLIQEDLVILEKPEGGSEHVLTGAIVCFPSNWTLAQKVGLPLGRIHLPVERYDESVAARVQRLFDAVRPEAPLVRANLLPYAHDRLHSPRREFHRHAPGPGEARFLRSERQVILRLPGTHAVVFSIHTFLIDPATLPPEQRDRLSEILPGRFEGLA